jgi:hypothetical protein
MFPALTLVFFFATEAEPVAPIPASHPLWVVVNGVALVVAALVIYQQKVAPPPLPSAASTSGVRDVNSSRSGPG